MTLLAMIGITDRSRLMFGWTIHGVHEAGNLQAGLSLIAIQAVSMDEIGIGRIRGAES